jgi:hypothetical protein
MANGTFDTLKCLDNVTFKAIAALAYSDAALARSLETDDAMIDK